MKKAFACWKLPIPRLTSISQRVGWTLASSACNAATRAGSACNMFQRFCILFLRWSVFTVSGISHQLFQTFSRVIIFKFMEYGQSLIPIGVHLFRSIGNTSCLRHLPDDILHFFLILILVLV